MLPANSGINGWDMEILSTQLLYPRNDVKDPFRAYAQRAGTVEIWTVVYRIDQIQLLDAAGELVYLLPIDPDFPVLNIDLTFDQLGRYFIVWEIADAQVWVRWYDPDLAAHTTVQMATGNNPCCMLDDIRDSMLPLSDIFIFYQRADEVFYRLQRELYLLEHEIPHTHTDVKLETCGMGTNLRMTLRTASTDTMILMAGETPVGVDNAIVGLPWGEIPWDKN